jgi:hypothetical protein
VVCAGVPARRECKPLEAKLPRLEADSRKMREAVSEYPETHESTRNNIFEF